MSVFRERVAVGFGLLILLGPTVGNGAEPPGADSSRCAEAFLEEEAVLKEHWQSNARTLQGIQVVARESESILESLAVAVLSGKSLYAFGSGGGAKTAIVRAFFAAELRGLEDREKRIFLQQFHRLLSESAVVGVQKLSSALKGKYEVDTSTTLVSDKVFFAVLDELDKAAPGVLAALLSILNEKRAFLGVRVVESFMRAAVATSNKSLWEMQNGEDVDRESIEALLDRIPRKVYVPNQLLRPGSRAAIRHLDRVRPPEFSLTLTRLEPLLKRVRIPRDVLAAAAKMLTDLDAALVSEAEDPTAQRRSGQADKRGRVAAHQFSNRVNRMLVMESLRATFVVHQLLSGVPYSRIRLEVTHGDLVHLAEMAVLGGPGRLRKRYYRAEGDERQQFLFRSNDLFVPTRALSQFEIDPFDGFVRYEFVDEPGIVRRFSFDVESGEFFDSNLLLDQASRDTILEIARRERSAGLTIESSPEVDQYLALRRLQPSEIQDLEGIRKYRTQAAAALNSILAETEAGRSAESLLPAEGVGHEVPDWSQWTDRIDELAAKGSDLEIHEKQELAWLRASLFYRSLKHQFLEMDHVIDALFTGLITSARREGDRQGYRAHVLLHGPPGAAKSLVARSVLEAAIRGLRLSDERESWKIFELQFNPKTPVGVLTGFQDIDAQVAHGNVRYDTETSLINPRYRYALLDEIHQANPAVKQKLFPILNEGEVTNTGDVERVGLDFAVMTSNKTPHELYLSFGPGEETTARAFIDRTYNLVYVSNKFSSSRVLFEFLRRSNDEPDFDLTHGGRAYLDVTTLAQMSQAFSLRSTEGVAEYSDPYMDPTDQRLLELLDNAFYEAVGKFIQHEQEILAKEDRQRTLYFPSTGPSTRTYLAMMRQMETGAALVERLSQGRSFAEIGSRVIEHVDLGALLLRGVPTWAPGSLEQIDSNGFVQFRWRSDILTALKNQSYVSRRQKDIIEQLIFEHETIVGAINSEIQRVLSELQEFTRQFPRLYPSLVIDVEEAARWNASFRR